MLIKLIVTLVPINFIKSLKLKKKYVKHVLPTVTNVPKI